MTRLAALLVAAALAATVAALAGGASAGRSRAASNTVTFPDSTGEDPQSADMASVTVSNTDAGVVTFRIAIPGRPTFTGDMAVLVFVDSDANPATGDADLLGADYVIQLVPTTTGGSQVSMFRWNGSQFATTSQLTLVSSYQSGATISVNANELGAPKRINFGVETISGIVLDAQGNPDLTNAHRDLAPDEGRGFYPFEVKIPPLALRVKSVGQTPKTPKAGGSFSVFLTAARSDTGATIKSGTVTCTATIAFKAVVARVHRVIGDRATCTFVLPKTAKGKTIRGTVVLRFEDVTAKRSFAAKIG